MPNIDVYCARCGIGICGNAGWRGKNGQLEVEPCGRCMQIKYDEGYEAGKREEREETNGN